MARTWRNLAAPDAQDAWYDVDGFRPTGRGSYRSVQVASSTSYTATGSGQPIYAFYGRTLSSGDREYAVDTSHIWQLSGGLLSDVTGGVTVGPRPMMTMYGDVAICAMGVGTATAKSTGGNFSALAGAPQAEIVLVCSNAVVYLNTNTSTDGWAASDVGDYTNYTTGESASGRLIATSGPIIGGLVFGDAVYAFKRNAIYRMRYVGGVVKWATEVVWVGTDLLNTGSGKYAFAAGPNFMVFNGATRFPDSYMPVYAFDGSSPPRIINHETDFGASMVPSAIIYNANTNEFVAQVSNDILFYSVEGDAWGRATAALLGTSAGSVQMVLSSVPSDCYSLPVMWSAVASNALVRYKDGLGFAVPSCYLQTSKFGRADRKTFFSRLTPLLRKRTDQGTDSAALSFTLYRELEDTTAQTTRAITESTSRKRFDLDTGTCADNFARFKVTWTALDVEVDDFLVTSRDAGAE